jgi:Glycosyl transferase family 2
MAPVDPRLVGRFLDRPRPGELADGPTLPLMGWVLGQASRAVAVELREGERVLRRLPLDDPRLDLVSAFPDVPDAAQGGFRSRLETVGMGEVELDLQAVLADQQRVPLATLRLTRRWREDAYHIAAPLVSVVITCYDQARYLAEAIESVMAQSYPHIELVVVDDGSHDNTVEVAARYPGVRLVSQANAGLSAARNAGIRHTNGAYLIFLDADDRLLPEAVADGLAAFAQHPEAAFVVGRYRTVDADGIPLTTSARAPLDDDPYAALLELGGAWMPGSAMYRRALFEVVGTFEGRFDPVGAYELSLRASRDLPVNQHGRLVGERRDVTAHLDAHRAGAAIVETFQRQWPYARRSSAFRTAFAAGLDIVSSRFGDHLIKSMNIEIRIWYRTRALRRNGPTIRPQQEQSRPR